MKNFEDMKGATITSIEGLSIGSEFVKFVFDDGNFAVLIHEQDCCEDVRIDDVIGDCNDLVGTPILLSEERLSDDPPRNEEWDESYTWTFYELRTIKGSVTIKWYGTSNGYYSESVDFLFNKASWWVNCFDQT